MYFLVILMSIFVIVNADKCYPYATIIEVDSFYLTQPFRKNITINIENYINAFPKMSDNLSKFKDNLSIYTNITEIESSEPQTLIPFTNELNAFVITELHPGKDSFKQCSLNKGSLIKLDSSNRAKVIEIMKKQGITKTPVHILPYHSLMSVPNFEILEPSVPNFGIAWTRTPPLLTSDNTIIPATGSDEGGTTPSPDSVKTQILCVKPNNPWDLENGRKTWFKIAPQVETAIKMLSNLKTKYELSSKALRNVPRITKQIAEAFKLSLPDTFQQVLGFLDTFSRKSNWESVRKHDIFDMFVKTSLKLVRQFETNPSSITKLPPTKPKFSPQTINELNWQSLFGLDDVTYGIIGPVLIEPNMAYAENEQILNPSFFEATISARVYNRKTDKVIIYSVKPNSVRSEKTTVKTIIETPHLKLALLDEVRPLQCHWHDTEQFKICHKMPLNTVTNIPVNHLKQCAEVLLTSSFNTKFENCPRIKTVTIPSVYRAECEPDGTTTAIINSDSTVLLEFVCDGKKMPMRNITSFPTFIPTPCEVNIHEGPSSQLLLPQINADFYQDQVVGEHESLELPEIELSQNLLILICVGASVASMLTVIIIVMIIHSCYKCCCKRRNVQEEPIEFRPEPAQYFPAIRMHEIPYIN